MIVMKFGGSSVESAEAIARMVGVVRSQLSRRPVVVVSALGKTTDQLLEFAEEARRGGRYVAAKCLDELQEYHFAVAEQVACGAALDWLERSLQRSFRDLRVMLFEVAEEGREFTPALQDEISSFGERMSSEIVTAALESAGVDSIHLDARQLILTDDCHTHAQPLYWGSYAKLRRAIVPLAENRVVVLGGFIGSTEGGATTTLVTTTLGRGGSDLTASIVGAGISAEEIQIWTDVDGMLTADPQVLAGGYRLKGISFEEAATMARSGAKVLHPDTVTPAVRQRIPIVIRNSRRPELEGTRITELAPACSNPVKAIISKSDLTVLELRPSAKDAAVNPEALAAALSEMCARHGVPAEFVSRTNEAIFLAVKRTARCQDLPFGLDGCVEVRLHPRAAILSLVGAGITASPEVAARAVCALKQIPNTLVTDVNSKMAVNLIVPRLEMERCVEILHREFFKQVDPAVFVESERETRNEKPETSNYPSGSSVSRPSNSSAWLEYRFSTRIAGPDEKPA
jgi:aspartate kinase